MSALITEWGVAGVTVAWVGLLLVLGGLFGEVIAIFSIQSLKHEKLAMAACALVIALGVWLEHVGATMEAAPRTLSPRQQVVITNSLKPFAGTIFQVIAPPDDPEPASLAEKIISALHAADWGSIPPVALVGSVAGVVVAVKRQGATDDEKKAATALVSALKSANIICVLAAPSTFASMPSMAIQIQVGRKP